MNEDTDFPPLAVLAQVPRPWYIRKSRFQEPEYGELPRPRSIPGWNRCLYGDNQPVRLRHTRPSKGVQYLPR
jgi:hypothetical protein